MAAHLKAIIAALVAALGSLGTALTDGVVTPAEWLTAAVALLVGLGATSVASNAGFVNVDKLPAAGYLAAKAYEMRTQADWSLVPADKRAEWTNATDAVLSALRR